MYAEKAQLLGFHLRDWEAVVSLLIDTLRARLANKATLDELAQVIEQSRSELSRHENESLTSLAGAPNELVDYERRGAQAAYQRYRDLLCEGQATLGDSAALTELIENLEIAGEELGLALDRVREVAWVARGPSTHPGANELLSLLQGLARGHDLKGSFEIALERELELAERQWEHLAELPEFVREAQEESLKLYQEWLRGVLAAPENGPQEWDAMTEELEQWAADYSSFDLDYLLRRYSAAPTAIPSLNFALNCQRLDLEELLPEEMVAYAISSAATALREEEERFLTACSSLTSPERQRYRELTNLIRTALQELPRAREATVLAELGAALAPTINDLVAIHRRAESATVTPTDGQEPS